MKKAPAGKTQQFKRAPEPTPASATGDHPLMVDVAILCGTVSAIALCDRLAAWGLMASLPAVILIMGAAYIGARLLTGGARNHGH